MTTKERISYEALTLFSRKGYKGTSVKNIADAVGIKDSSLYKHFASKQEILDSIMVTIKQRTEEMSKEFGIPEGEDFERAVAFYAELDQESLARFSKNIFLFYLKDDILSKFWRMGSIEQVQNEQVYSLFRKFFIEDSIKYQTALFAEMSHQGIFIEADPGVMAISFYTPIFFLLSKYSAVEGQEEEALAVLDKQVREFYRIYRK
ncbi:MAG: TetR/AcrR family transcriptional regulator [bacterium]|nr:TetR/AcrR family transcriptional regulator [bacterium]